MHSVNMNITLNEKKCVWYIYVVYKILQMTKISQFYT